MRARAVPAVLFGAAVALVAVTAACGGADPAVHGPDPLAKVSARQIVSEALARLEQAGSVHISGTLTQRPGPVHPWATGPVRNVVTLVTSKQACAGTDTVSGLASGEDYAGTPPQPERGMYRFDRIGSQAWVKGDAAFYTHFWFMDNGMSVTAGSKYVYLDAGADPIVSRLCDVSKWLTVPPNARPAKVGRVMLAGQIALKIRVSPAEYLYVSDTKKPVVLRVTVPGTQDVAFTRYETPVPVIRPAARDTITVTGVIAANR